jgi:hypothetical protein
VALAVQAYQILFLGRQLITQVGVVAVLTQELEELGVLVLEEMVHHIKLHRQRVLQTVAAVAAVAELVAVLGHLVRQAAQAS